VNPGLLDNQRGGIWDASTLLQLSARLPGTPGNIDNTSWNVQKRLWRLNS